jgi:hypothetical protein
MKRAFKIGTLAAVAVAVLAGSALADDVDRKIKKLPGYVDFNAMKLFEDQEPRVEVFLKEPMLNLVTKFMREEEPELHDVLSKLKLVRVQIFDLNSDMIGEFNDATKSTTGELDKKGWERIVRVREDDSNVDIYLLPSESYESILGIVVMVAEDEEAIFVNIVGEINPDDVARLGDHFDIEELHDIKADDIKKNKKR